VTDANVVAAKPARPIDRRLRGPGLLAITIAFKLVFLLPAK
jgi:hypothetical protein